MASTSSTLPRSTQRLWNNRLVPMRFSHFPTRFGLGFALTMPEQAGASGTGIRHSAVRSQPARLRASGGRGLHWLCGLGGRIGFGYVMNQYQTGTPRNPDLRWVTLVEAAYKSLGAK